MGHALDLDSFTAPTLPPILRGNLSELQGTPSPNALPWNLSACGEGEPIGSNGPFIHPRCEGCLATCNLQQVCSGLRGSCFLIAEASLDVRMRKMLFSAVAKQDMASVQSLPSLSNSTHPPTHTHTLVVTFARAHRTEPHPTAPRRTTRAQLLGCCLHTS